MKFTVFRMYHLILIFLLLMGLPARMYAQQQTAVTLDEAISKVAEYLIQHNAMPKDSGIADAGFTAPTEALAHYIISELRIKFEGHFTIVRRERRYEELLQQEIDKADVEAVNRASQQRYGLLEGVRFYIDGSIARDGDAYSLHLFVIEIERRAQVAEIKLAVYPTDRKLLSLLKPFRFLLGARAGGSPHLWTLSDDIKGSAENPSLAFAPAVHGAVYFNDLFALQTELALSIDNVSYSGREAGDVSGESRRAYTASFESVSLQWPILFRFTYRPGNCALSAFGGVSFNIPLGDMKVHSSLYDDSSYRFSIPPGYVIGANVGWRPGLRERRWPGFLFLDARFSGDFARTAIHDDSGTLALYRRNTWSFSLGYEWEFIKEKKNR